MAAKGLDTGDKVLAKAVVRDASTPLSQYSRSRTLSAESFSGQIKIGSLYVADRANLNTTLGGE
jgi:hypothetical protein